MTPFWLGIIAGTAFGTFFGVIVMALYVSSKNADLYQEVEWSRYREEQLRNLEKAVRGN